MPRISCHNLFIILCGTCLFGLASCHKSQEMTTINGVVVDSVTNEPLANTSVEFDIALEDIAPPHNFEYHDLYTDANGRFSYKNYAPMYVYWVVKDGYLPKGEGTRVVNVEQGKVNDVTIKLIPKDGTLKLKLTNSAGVHDTIYAGIYSKLLETEMGISYGFVSDVDNFFKIPVNSMDEATIKLASGEKVDIFWAFSRWPTYSSIKQSANRDSIYITRNDTTSFNIIY